MADEKNERAPENPVDAASATQIAKRPTMNELGFTGCYTHGLDTKGRLIIPANLRELLGKTFAVSVGNDLNKIALYPLDSWMKQRDEYAELMKSDAKAGDMLKRFTKFSYLNGELDAQGRLLLPTKLRQKVLGEAVREVDIIGIFDHIEIEDSHMSDEEDEAFAQKYPDVLDAIAKMQKGL